MANDIWLFSASDNLEGELLLSFGNNLKSVRGIELLANMFTHVFLTQIDTDLSYPDIGTDFAEMIGGNIFVRNSFIQGLISLAVKDTLALIQSEQVRGTTPEDEFLETVDILDYSILGDTISVRVEIFSSLGENRTVVIPTRFST